MKKTKKTKKWLTLGCLAAMLAALGMAGTGRHDVPSAAAPQAVSQANTSWNSGWMAIAPGQTLAFTHSLGGDPALYAVDLWFRDTRSPGLGLHQRAYGGMDVAGARYGAYWHNLTADAISVTRLPDDVAIAQVLLRVWIPDPPDYDSGWVNIAPGAVLPFTHNLGGNADDYTVGLKFQDTTTGGLGIHHYAFGGLEAAGLFHGAAWQNLTDTAIEVQRFGGDAAVHQVRLLITRPDPPDYDSGWVDVAQGATQTLAHNLGGEPHTYVVRPSARSAAAGINTRAAGGLEASSHFYGSNWQNLTASAINLFRRPHDTFAEQVRLRIWLAEAGPWQSWTNANFVRKLALQG